MAEILVCDDDKDIVEAIEIYLTQEGYHILKAYDGEQAIQVLQNNKVDLLIIDVMMPKLDGIRATLKIREKNSIPIIILSAKSEDADKILGLNVGADDYVTKPFDTKELLARITVALRTPTPSLSRILKFQDIVLDTYTHEVFVADKKVKLTRTEYAILKLLLQNPKQVVVKSILLDKISENTPDCTEGSLKMHISNLRKKLRDISGKDYIEAVWGIGFKMRTE